MHRSHIPIEEWFWAAYLMATHTPGISALQLQRQLGIGGYQHAWHLLHRLRRGMVNDLRSPLSGLIEADESILGGPAKKRRGRGVTSADHKTLIGGAVEVIKYEDTTGKRKEKAGRLRLLILFDASERSIGKFLGDNVAPGSKVRTDGWRGYSETAMEPFRHTVKIAESPERASRLTPHIHRVFSNLKTWLAGTYHGVDPKHLQSYLDEFTFRFNRRATPMAAFQTLLGISVRKAPLTFKALVSA
ncbi:MAG: hypothetical protein DDT25_01210 [Chloroflexi bacterium]|nr:hypothetical protein [Chloroflexota bacterium]